MEDPGNIVHIDMDAFFAAVEARDNPEYRGKPLIICGSNTKRGIVSTSSYEARKCGVYSAMPVTEARRRCPDGIFIPGSKKKYAEESRKLRKIFYEFSPQVEPISIDEAFLDLSGGRYIYKDSVDAARRLKEEIMARRKLSSSVGVSYNKFLAKLASEQDKPDGFFVISQRKAEDLLPELSVDEIWGVGIKTADKLKEQGVQTIGELRKLKLSRLEALFGKKGKVIYNLCRGKDPREVEGNSSRKSVSKEETYYSNLNCITHIRSESLRLLDAVLYRLRKKNLMGMTLTLKIRYSDFQTITRSMSLEHPSCYSKDFKPALDKLLEEVNFKSRSIRLIGIGVSRLTHSGYQLTLEDDEQRYKLTSVLDSLKNEHGEESIFRASKLIGEQNEDK